MIQDERGFTLIEMLITLMFIGLMIVLTLPYLIAIFEKQAEKQFFTSLEQDVLLLQNSTFRTFDYNRVIFRKDHYRLALPTDRNESINRQYPKHITLSSDHSLIVEYNHRGTVIDPSTITFRVKNRYIDIVFPFGKGRFYVNE